MNKKNIAIIIEAIPIVSAIISFILIKVPYNLEIFNHILMAATIIALLGFIFRFIGRKLNKDDNIVQVLSILDIFATIYVIVLYTIAIFGFGL